MYVAINCITNQMPIEIRTELVLYSLFPIKGMCTLANSLPAIQLDMLYYYVDKILCIY